LASPVHYNIKPVGGRRRRAEPVVRAGSIRSGMMAAMESDANSPSGERWIVGIVGAGVMGSGIAQVALEAGHEVVLHDIDDAALARGRDRIVDGLTRRAARAAPDPSAIDDWIGARTARLRVTTVLEQLGDEADIVIEAALESIDLKTTIFRTLDAASAGETILATNTSALSIASIAAATTRPGRVVGLHFFNPAPLMALVEVVSGPATDPDVATAAEALVVSWGKTAIRSSDSPGFIVNRVNRPFTLEALRLLEKDSASIEAIDQAMRDGGFPLGPFELMALTGIDVTYVASTAIWERLGRPDRLRPSPIQERLIEAGHLGRKAGRGFYRYEDGRRAGPADVDPASSAAATDSARIREEILSAIDGEARLVAAEGVASEADIDLAMRLGANHPIGPFERAGRGFDVDSVPTADR
jgi:3-hydroxybutyryl-CoA dehydrogenase